MTFGFTNVIIIIVAILVIHLVIFIFQTTISFIGLESMVCICPGEQIAPIRVPFQLVNTVSIITFILVWIMQSSPKVIIEYIILNKRHLRKLLSKY